VWHLVTLVTVAAIIFGPCANPARAQAVEFGWGNRYEVEVLGRGRCQIELRKVAAKKPEVSPETPPQLRRYKSIHAVFDLRFRNVSGKPLRSIKFLWRGLAADQAVVQAYHFTYRPERQENRHWQVVTLNAKQAPEEVERYTLEVTDIVYSDGTFCGSTLTQEGKSESRSSTEAREASPKSADAPGATSGSDEPRAAVMSPEPPMALPAEAPISSSNISQGERLEAEANRGDPDAQFALGMMFWEGRERLQDYVVAHMWLNLAASIGHDKAIEQRDSLAKKMSVEQIAEAQRLAREWRAEAGH
jgi:hypothetical protein